MSLIIEFTFFPCPSSETKMLAWEQWGGEHKNEALTRGKRDFRKPPKCYFSWKKCTLDFFQLNSVTKPKENEH